MTRVEAKLAELGLALPETLRAPAGARLAFTQVRVRGNRAYVAGHGPTNADGTVAQPLGKVGTGAGATVTPEQGYQAARLVALSMLGDLKRALGDLDRVTAWLRIFGMVNVAPGFNQTAAVINGCSDLIVDLYGPEVGIHARCAVGMAELPFDIPVEIEAEVEIDG